MFVLGEPTRTMELQTNGQQRIIRTRPQNLRDSRGGWAGLSNQKTQSEGSQKVWSLLLHIKKTQLRVFNHLVSMSPWTPPYKRCAWHNRDRSSFSFQL